MAGRPMSGRPMSGRSIGGGAAMSGRPMGGGVAGMHANDIEYDAFLANDRTLADPEVVPVEPRRTPAAAGDQRFVRHQLPPRPRRAGGHADRGRRRAGRACPRPPGAAGHGAEGRHSPDLACRARGLPDLVLARGRARAYRDHSRYGAGPRSRGSPKPATMPRRCSTYPWNARSALAGRLPCGGRTVYTPST